MDTLAQPLVGSQHPNKVCDFIYFFLMDYHFYLNMRLVYGLSRRRFWYRCMLKRGLGPSLISFLCQSIKVIYHFIYFRIFRSCLQARQRWRLFMAQCKELYSQDTGRQTDWQHIIRRQWHPLPLPQWKNKFRELKTAHNQKFILWVIVSNNRQITEKSVWQRTWSQ